MARNCSSRGFSLIELLTVIALIVILAAIVYPTFQKAREKGRQAACISNLHQVYQAIKIYRDDYKAYPLPPYHNNDFWKGAISSLYPDYLSSVDVLQCPNEERLDTRHSKPPQYGGVLASTYNGLHASNNPLSLQAVFYNYYGYSRVNLNPNGTPQPQPGWLPTAMTLQEWQQLGYPKGRQFPCLVDRNAPPNTVVTLCPWHRQHFGREMDKERFLILRLDGSVKSTKWIDFDWIRQPGL